MGCALKADSTGGIPWNIFGFCGIWYGILQKMESPYFFLKRRISTLKKLKLSWSQAEIPLFKQNYGLSTLWTIPHFSHSTKSKEFRPWNSLFWHLLKILFETQHLILIMLTLIEKLLDDANIFRKFFYWFLRCLYGKIL